MIILEGVESCKVVGLFESEGRADRFIRRYAAQYGRDDIFYLEQYWAVLSYEGQGPILEETDSERSDSGGTEYLDFDGVRSQNS